MSSHRALTRDWNFCSPIFHATKKPLSIDLPLKVKLRNNLHFKCRWEKLNSHSHLLSFSLVRERDSRALCLGQKVEYDGWTISSNFAIATFFLASVSCPSGCWRSEIVNVIRTSWSRFVWVRESETKDRTHQSLFENGEERKELDRHFFFTLHRVFIDTRFFFCLGIFFLGFFFLLSWWRLISCQIWFKLWVSWERLWPSAGTYGNYFQRNWVVWLELFVAWVMDSLGNLLKLWKMRNFSWK